MGVSSSKCFCLSKDHYKPGDMPGIRAQQRSDKQYIQRAKDARIYVNGTIPKSIEERNAKQPEQEYLLKRQEISLSTMYDPQDVTSPQAEGRNNPEEPLKQEKDGVPDYIAEHPIYQQYGMDVCSTHTLLEFIYGFTYYRTSLLNDVNLTLVEGQDEQSVFKLDAFKHDIEKIFKYQCSSQNQDKLNYLCDVYKRLQITNQPKLLSNEQKGNLKKILFSYIITGISSKSPDFYKDMNPMNCDGEMILNFVSSSHDALYSQFATLDKNFIEDFFENVENETLDEVLTPIFKIIIRDCNDSSITEVGKLLQGIEVLAALLQADNRVVEAFVNHQLYIPKRAHIDGVYFQKFSLFGACLSLTSFTDEFLTNPIVHGNFKISHQPEEKIKALRADIHKAVHGVHKIMEYMIHVDQKYKQNILDWCYQALVLNEDKRKMYNQNANKVSSKGWFTNFLLLLLKFCQNLLTDIEKSPHWCTQIQISFLQERQLFKECILLNNKPNIYTPTEGLTEEHKNDQTDRSEENSKKASSKYTFRTKILFFASHALLLHIGANKRYVVLMDKLIDYGQDPARKQENIILYSNKLYHDVQLRDPYLYKEIYKLLTFQVLLILNSYDIPIQDLKNIDRAFEQTASIKMADMETKCLLPLYWAENILEYLLHFRRINEPLLLESTKHSEILMDFILSVIRRPDWIGTPHLKALSLEFLGAMLPNKKHLSFIIDHKENVENFKFLFLFRNNQYYNKYLIEGLINVFVETEKIGDDYQFMEKVKYRLTCCEVLSYLLVLELIPSDNTAIHASKRLDEVAKRADDAYAKFIVIYLNDIIRLLDKLKEIKTYQEADKEVLYTLNIALRTYYEMANWITKVSPNFFLSPEIKEKFITNLNHSLQLLNGDDAINLNIVAYEPRFLLVKLIRIYLNLVDKGEFIETIVRDERNFNMQVFHKTGIILLQHSMLNAQENKAFISLMIQLEKEIKEKTEEDKFMSEITDVPEEFLDPLLQEIMKDPVLVPTSNKIMERAVILQHLLNDGTDPFNQVKLTKEMLVPQPELKKKIEEFFRQKRQSKYQDKTIL